MSWKLQSGYWKLLDMGVAMPLQQVPVLLYHHINRYAGDVVTVTPEVFSRQIRYLHDEGYQSLSADELFEFVAGKRILSGKAVVLTFDDGWLDNYLNAVPLLSHYRMKATFFLVSGRIDAASMQPREETVEIPDHDISKRLIAGGSAHRVVISWSIAREMERSGLFRCYSHTVSHRRCAGLDDADLKTELVVSKERIESMLGRSCDYLCWPYGSFDCRAVSSAVQAGYKGFFTTVDGFCAAGSDPDMIKRIEVSDSLENLQHRLTEGS